MWSEFRIVGLKIVKRLRRPKLNPVIIERAISRVHFLKHCTLTNKAVGTIWRDLPTQPQTRQGPDPRPL